MQANLGALECDDMSRRGHRGPGTPTQDRKVVGGGRNTPEKRNSSCRTRVYMEGQGSSEKAENNCRYSSQRTCHVGRFESAEPSSDLRSFLNITYMYLISPSRCYDIRLDRDNETIFRTRTASISHLTSDHYPVSQRSLTTQPQKQRKSGKKVAFLVLYGRLLLLASLDSPPLDIKKLLC